MEHKVDANALDNLATEYLNFAEGLSVAKRAAVIRLHEIAFNPRSVGVGALPASGSSTLGRLDSVVETWRADSATLASQATLVRKLAADVGKTPALGVAPSVGASALDASVAKANTSAGTLVQRQSEAPKGTTPARSGSYTVKKGDSLSTIARWHGITVQELTAYNKLKSTTLKIGQTLSIPPGYTYRGPGPTGVMPPAPTPKPAIPAPVAPPALSVKRYVVRSGTISPSLEPKVARLANEYFRLTGRNLDVSSGYRGPRKQAEAMFNKIRKEGAAKVRSLYTNKVAVDAIIAASRKASPIDAMERVIQEQMSRGVYISLHLLHGAIDVPKTANLTALKKAAAVAGASVLVESDHYHLQF